MTARHEFIPDAATAASGWVLCEICGDTADASQHSTTAKVSIGGFGLPYAPAGVDDLGYFMQCPECALRIHSTTDDDGEDAITKRAGVNYAEHYEEAHR
jgi:hypothetical protein